MSVVVVIDVEVDDVSRIQRLIAHMETPMHGMTIRRHLWGRRGRRGECLHDPGDQQSEHWGRKAFLGFCEPECDRQIL